MGARKNRMPGKLQGLGSASEPTPSTSARKPHLAEIKLTVERLDPEKKKRLSQADVTKIRALLNTTGGKIEQLEEQIDKIRGRLGRLKDWIPLYNGVLETLQQSESLQERLSAKSSTGKENQETLAQEIRHKLRPVILGYGKCAWFKKGDTGSLVGIEAGFLHALGQFGEQIETVKANRKSLLETQDDAEFRKVYTEIENYVEEMVTGMLLLHQDLRNAIDELVGDLSKLIE